MASNPVMLRGLDGLLAALQALPPAVASKNGGPARVALAKGAKVILEDARARAPKASGDMAKSLIMYRDRNPKKAGANERYVIGVPRIKKKYANTKRNVRKGRQGKEYQIDGDTYYWRFIEFGTERQPAQPFIRPAFESQKENALAVITDTLAKGIEAAAKKVARTG